MSFDYDLLVIGAGSGGVRAARMSATMGAKVAIIESRDLGGTCVNVGCVPKKLFVYASEYSQAFEDSAGFGYTVDEKPEFNWATLRDNKTKEIQRLNGVYQRLLENSGVDIIYGKGSFISDHQVKVGEDVYSAKHILIATGSYPYKSSIPGNEHVITSDEFFYMEEFPKQAIVVGAGYIAVEFAGILNGLGAKTHIVYRGNPVLRGFDEDFRYFVSDELAQAGIELHYERTIERVDKLSNGRLKTYLSDGTELEVDTIINAIGRKPLVEPLNLSAAGIELHEQGHIEVNQHFQTNVGHIYAVGDVIGRMQLTPVALAEGMYVAHNLFSDKTPRAIDYDLIPTAVFCQPNLATVGLTEQQAAAKFDIVDVYESTFKPMKNTLSGNPQRMFMKLLVDKATDRVIGCHMAGQDAGEIIQGIAVAMQAGATKEHFDSTIGIHPTAAEEFVTMRAVSRTVGRSVK